MSLSVHKVEVSQAEDLRVDDVNLDTNSDVCIVSAVKSTESSELKSSHMAAIDGAVLDVARKVNKGLENSANLCWLNSILQVLLTTPLHLILKSMKIEYLSHIQKAFVDLMECIEVKSDNPSDPSRLATLLTMNAAYLRMGCQNDCCEGFTALFDQLMTGSKVLSKYRQLFATTVHKKAICCSKPVCETTDWSVISCSVEEHQEISIMELMKMWIDSFLNEMEGPHVECEKCNQHLDIHSREVSFPSHMMIHCDRVSLSRKPKKLNCRVLLPCVEHVSYLHATNKPKYELSALVIHHGTHTGKGHYTCLVRSRDQWIRYSDTQVSIITSFDYICSQEVQENVCLALYTSPMAVALLDECTADLTTPNSTNSNLRYPGLPEHLEAELKLKVPMPSSTFQLEKQDLINVASGGWIDSKIIASYFELMQRSNMQKHGIMTKWFDPTFIPLLKAKGYSAVKRYCKGKDLLKNEVLLFPVHKPQHWSLLVVHIQRHVIRCIDSLHQSNIDAVNWIWLYISNELRHQSDFEDLMHHWTYQDSVGSNSPMQRNPTDCGVFVCFAARLIVDQLPLLHTQGLMDAFRLQMVYELSVGDLQPIVEKSSSISDHNEEVKLPQAERTICAKQDQESNAGSLGCDIDAADDEDDSYAEAENDTDCNSDTDGDHNAGVPQDFLVPDFRNAPDPDDIFALRWGKSLYMKNFPHFKRKTLDKHYPFPRHIIRRVVKDLEPTLRAILSKDTVSDLQIYFNEIKQLHKEDLYWPLLECSDMVLEVFYYLQELDCDVKKQAALSLSLVNKCVVWPEIVVALLMNTFNLERKKAIKHFLNHTLPSFPVYNNVCC
eukprot:Em0003g991a